MAKPFTEVFPSMDITGEYEDMFKKAHVEGVKAPRDMSSVSIAVLYPTLIRNHDIRAMEELIRQRLFPNKQIIVRIEPHFTLSSQYTPENLYKEYKEDIYEELSAKRFLARRMLQKAEITFTDDTMTVVAEDTDINRHLGVDMERYLTRLFNDRCGLSCRICLEYRQAQNPDAADDDIYEYEQLSDAYLDRVSSEPYMDVPVVGGQGAVTAGESMTVETAATGKDMTAADAHAGAIDASSTAKDGMTASADISGAISSAGKPSAASGMNTSGQSAAGGTQTAGGAQRPAKPTSGAEKRNTRRGSGRGDGSYGRRGYAKSDDPDVLYGRSFMDEFTALSDIQEVIGEVSVHGRISEVVARKLKKNDLTMFSFDITDFTDSITVKMFIGPEEAETVSGFLKDGTFLKLRAATTIDRFDGELTLGSVRGIKKCEPFGLDSRTDDAPVKRVELHCHTNFSDLDAVSSPDDIIKQAARWGMDAIAITDHGNVQAFPVAFHAVQKIKEHAPKILYGVEGYLVDDVKDIVYNPGERDLNGTFVVFDIETTGLSFADDRIIEIGAVKVEGGEITDRFSTFVDPKMPIPYRIEKLTSINDSMVIGAGTIDEILPRFMEFCGDAVLVAHNADFDTTFIRRDAQRLGIERSYTIMDTLGLSRLLLPQLSRFKLDNVAKALGVSLENHHRAVDDAECTAHIFLKLAQMLKDRGVLMLRDAAELARADADVIKKMRMTHVVIFAKNETGRVNLYRLISYSHIDYFNKKPRIPKSVLGKWREGLIVGSACEAGELFGAIVRGESDEEIERLVKFYDYLEVQPIDNNRFMIDSPDYPATCEEDLREYNRRVIRLGELYDKPVVATGDVHFLNPQDEVYRRILFYGMGYDDADRQPPLYLHTTQEMLDEFSYLGADKAYEIVVTNTRMIADMCEYIEPVRPDKCPPVIEDSDKILQESCYAKAHEQYGDELPPIVEQRLAKELNSIISNGYAVMYIIAKKLVEKSMSDGYLVGSRGSVGSSFAAYTSGITEVNPLPAHYYCPKCKYSDFDSEDVRAYAGESGCDMPDKVCPVCGAQLKKDGHDIPFETFLGFNGDKEPDIDLNFSGEYQAKAHAYTEVIFGKGHTFRAGTIGTIADKTAYGYVKRYYEEHHEAKRKCEINRLLKGCVGIKRTTGQHPGGIIVLPHGEEIYSFTPVQRPANDMTTSTVTTHFEYHSIDQNLLKLDILGHQAPTIIRMLQDLTGIDPVRDIPLDSRETMELFKGTQVLGITPDDIGGCPLGSLGIPEFGTDFAMQMLIDAQPKGFSDLVRIAGLAHGTDVWLGNAQDLIKQGLATISTAICCRDDIMIYLIGMHMDPGKSFKIMEAVRKGKGLTPEWESEMREHGVPEWYIDSCKKIKYMFPKAHAAAYVMMSWRIAYCKIFYPLAYYAAYFSIMASGMNYELMCRGREAAEEAIRELKSKDKLSATESDTLRDLKIAREMYARGYEFLPIDLYRSKATRFAVEDGRLRPSFASISGLGESVATQLESAAAGGEYLSRDDLKNRAKVGNGLIETLDALGVLEGLPESNQISLFDCF